MDEILVAVYGTLKIGGPLCIEPVILEHWGGENIRGKLYDLGHYPGIKLGGPSLVEVEIQRIPERYFEWMIVAEGYFFKQREAITEEGTSVRIFEFLGEISELQQIDKWEN
jgi:gamma-glutamylcyclotransferase (GGCT)/AIG2-like uncharacterized protein YtfP